MSLTGDNQYLVLPKLQFVQGSKHVIKSDTQLPFELIDTLGDGACGIVEKVANTDGIEYARKRFRWRHTEDRKAKKRIFENEINIIKSLGTHHHLIQVFATYMSPREFALLLCPVADGGDVSNFLTMYRHALQGTNSHNFMRQAIQRSFGCPANGLDFLHQNKIRHKDIKPGNILMHDMHLLAEIPTNCVVSWFSSLEVPVRIRMRVVHMSMTRVQNYLGVMDQCKYQVAPFASRRNAYLSLRVDF
jgi:serine/threonine protein kinase